MGWLALPLHAALVAVAALMLAGLRARAAARWRGVEGPALAQPWHDLVRLWRKHSVLPAGAPALFAAAPLVSLALAGVAALLVPSFTLGMATAPAADLVLLGALLAASRAVLLLAAWDAGAALAVQAAGRTLAARLGLAPVLLLAGLAALLLCGSTNLDAAVLAVRDGGTGARFAGLLAGAALFALALLPQTDPGPWSGRLRGLAVLSGHLRDLVALAVVAAVGCPFGLAAGPEAWPVGLACWVLKLGVLGLLATAIGTPRHALRAAALLALMAVVVAGTQGAA